MLDRKIPEPIKELIRSMQDCAEDMSLSRSERATYKRAVGQVIGLYDDRIENEESGLDSKAA